MISPTLRSFLRSGRGGAGRAGNRTLPPGREWRISRPWRSGELREDIPDPMAGFTTAANLRERDVVAGVRVSLGFVEASEGHGCNMDVAARFREMMVPRLPIRNSSPLCRLTLWLLLRLLR